jgi:hypothetical protein
VSDIQVTHPIYIYGIYQLVPSDKASHHWFFVTSGS